MRKLKNPALFFSFILIALSGNAQSFDDGANVISIGFGLPPGERIKNMYIENINYKYYDYKFKNYGTVVLKYEHGLHPNFGLGLNLEYSSTSATYKYDFTNSLRYEVKSRNDILGMYARMNGHYPVGDNFDLYAGVGLGYLYTIIKNDDTNPNTVYARKSTVFEFDYQFTLGARYMVKESIGLFGEVGWATTLFQLGVALKF